MKTKESRPSRKDLLDVMGPGKLAEFTLGYLDFISGLKEREVLAEVFPHSTRDLCVLEDGVSDSLGLSGVDFECSRNTLRFCVSKGEEVQEVVPLSSVLESVSDFLRKQLIPETLKILSAEGSRLPYKKTYYGSPENINLDNILTVNQVFLWLSGFCDSEAQALKVIKRVLVEVPQIESNKRARTYFELLAYAPFGFWGAKVGSSLHPKKVNSTNIVTPDGSESLISSCFLEMLKLNGDGGCPALHRNFLGIDLINSLGESFLSVVEMVQRAKTAGRLGEAVEGIRDRTSLIEMVT